MLKHLAALLMRRPKPGSLATDAPAAPADAASSPVAPPPTVRSLAGNDLAAPAEALDWPPETRTMHAVHALSLRPLVVASFERTLHNLHLMPTDFPVPCLFLQIIWWSLEVEGAVARQAQSYAEHRRRRPQDRFVTLCNTQAELDLARAGGLDAVLAPQNMMVDDRIFRPLPDADAAPAEFDAVYNAAFHDWKRHILAAETPRLGLIGYFHRRGYDVEDPYLAELRAAMPAAQFCNRDGDGMRRLEEPEVNAILNRARTGLCLSAVEGANYASMEYLMSGLPVVSTPSKGGRDYFFDDEYCAIVAPDPRAVRDAVAGLIARDIPRTHIRARTMALVERERALFVEVMQERLDRMGAGRRFAEDWPQVYVNKLYHADWAGALWHRLAQRVIAPPD